MVRRFSVFTPKGITAHAEQSASDTTPATRSVTSCGSAAASARTVASLPGSLIVDGAEYLPADAAWRPSGGYGAEELSDVRRSMSFSAAYLCAPQEAGFTVRHCWLGDPEVAICEDISGTARVGEILRWEEPAEVPGYAFLRAG